MSIEEIIRKKIIDSGITIHHLEIKDFTGRHLNHDLHTGGFHLEAIIVSDTFEGKNLIERHKMIYTALDKLMQKEIHALSMKTLTLSEWGK
tara:strand:+ start:273 stop:545 length:273 start_codon:yes stop_codon:yes gene_type:complete